MTLDPWQIIEDYARRNNVKPNTLRMWRQRGVPWKQRFELRELYPLVFSNPENFGPFRDAAKPRRSAKPKRRAA